MKHQWFKLNNLHDFVEHSRALVFTCFGDSNQLAEDYFTDTLSYIDPKDKEEMDRILTHEESLSIVESLVKKKISKKTQEPIYYITDNILVNVIEELNSRLISNLLNKLVNDEVLDSAYDTEVNDFVFWVKEKDEKTNPPKTD